MKGKTVLSALLTAIMIFLIAAGAVIAPDDGDYSIKPGQNAQFIAFDTEGSRVSSNIVNLSVISVVNLDEIPDEGKDAKHRGFHLHSEDTSDGCTLGVASGYVTVDGRPIICKVRATSDERQQLCYASGVPYDYIGVRSEGDGIYMGMNEAGVATGNSLFKLTPGLVHNSLFQRHILENYDTLDQIRDYVQSEVNAGTCNASGCFAFIDADGDAGIFEVSRADWFMEYDSMDPDREAQDLLGFVVRANEFHQRSDGTDDMGIGGRYESGTYNVKGLIGIDELSARTITHGNDYANDFEFVRYGPGRTLSDISVSRTRSAIVVHGVAPDEDPELATMWVILGQTNYGIAVPAWVRVSDIPQCLSSGDMYDRAKSLYNKGNKATTQASTFPVEAHMFDVVVNTFLPHWRAEGIPSVASMTRIEHQMANDAYSLLDCLDNYQNDNKAPHVSFNAFHHGLTVNFTLITNDPDGAIEDIEWNFDDGRTSRESSPSHTYAAPGTYLISCTVTDDDGVSITDWKTEIISAVGDGTTISVADANAQPGCSTTTRITINGMTNFGAATVTLSYDPAVVHITSVAAGDVGTPIADIDNTAGTATIAAYISTETGPDSPITFAGLELLTVGNSGEMSPLTLAITTLADADGVYVSATPIKSTFMVSTVVKGDLNSDGRSLRSMR